VATFPTFHLRGFALCGLDALYRLDALCRLWAVALLRFRLRCKRSMRDA
jgi:hypothetical protein